MASGASAPAKRATRPTDQSPVYAFLEKPSMIDFPGTLCAVFFLSGCNFTCDFCHNASLMGKKQTGISWERLEAVCLKFKNDWTDAVCITGGEPTLSADLIELIRFFKSSGFKVKLDSNGGRPDVLKECLPLIDYIAMDIKTGPSGYADLAGFPDTAKIEDSVNLIMTSGVNYEFRTTVIDPLHTDELMHEAGELIRGAKRLCLQAFIPQETLPGETFRQLKRTPPERLRLLEKLMTPYVDQIIIRGA